MSDDTRAEAASSPSEQLMPDSGEAGDTGLVDDSAAAGGSGGAFDDDRSFAEQDADKRPGDGPNARD